MTDQDFSAIKHDINSSTDNVKLILEMILTGEITDKNEQVLKEAISQMERLKKNQLSLFQKVEV